MSQTAEPVQLKEETLSAFAEHIRKADAEMDPAAVGDGQPFLWADRDEKRAKDVRAGKTIAEYWYGERPIHISDGLIHDWISAAWIPGATLTGTLALVQDYDNHKNIYRPEVIGSKLIQRNGNDFEMSLRVLKKKVVTVVLDSDHRVHYSAVDSARWCCRSHTTRVVEVKNAGQPDEHSLAPDTGHGFLWRLISYWRFAEQEAGVFLECRAISLTRDVPKGLGWMIEPIIKKLPRESLVHTLEATRDALSKPQVRTSAG